MKIVELKGVSRGYGAGDVLTGFDLGIEAGQVVGLLGRNGAGKTTLLRLVMGMLAPERGEVKVFGRDPRQDAVAVKRRIGFVSEDQDLPPHMRVRQVIALHRRLFPTWDDTRAAELGAEFALPLDRRIGDLSRGQARQVALLCAVSHAPELLVLDEPAGGLDPAARRQFLETSITLLNATGATIIFSSHHMADVERMASRLVMIHDHQKWIDSDLDEIREGYSLAVVPGGGATGPEDLLRLPRCLCARRHGDAVHAVFEHDPGACAVELETVLGVTRPDCRALNLEEMFIELAGRDR